MEILDQQITETQSLPFEKQCSSWTRLANFIIDTIAYYIVAFVIFMVIIMITGDDSIDTLTGYLNTFVSLILYYTLTEGLTGRTLGKLITGTKVVTEEGLRPSFGKAFGRSLCRLIPFEVFSFLGGRGWHDSFTDTYVIKVR